MRKALICGLLASLVLLTGSRAQNGDETGASGKFVRCYPNDPDSPWCWAGSGITEKVQAVPTLTEQEADIVAVYTQEWIELHEAFSHLASLREMLSWQMGRAEAELLKKHDLDPERWKLDWNTGEIKARDVGI